MRAPRLVAPLAVIVTAVALALPALSGAATKPGVQHMKAVVKRSSVVVQIGNKRINGTRRAKQRVIVQTGTWIVTVYNTVKGRRFHLVGPGVNKTSPMKVGKSVWHVVLKTGNYHFSVAGHSDMRGTFTVSRL